MSKKTHVYVIERFEKNVREEKYGQTAKKDTRGDI